jgi:WhiB family transcriptional regulator, redox-sensing transcriptional regulator
MTNTNWRQQAACRDSDPELFFPLANTGHQDATALCAGCPVATACLEDAFRAKDVHAFRAGTTGEERAGMLRARRTKPARKPTSAEKVLQLSAAGYTPREISARLDAHVDSVRRVLRKARATA